MGEYKAGGDQRSFLLLAPDVMSEAAKQAATVARCLSKQMQVTLSLHFLTYCPVIRGATRRRHLLRSGCHVLGGEEEKAGSIVAPADETWRWWYRHVVHKYRHAWHRSLPVPVPSGAEAAVPSTSCGELRSPERTLPSSLSTLSRQSEQCWSRCLKIRVQTKGQAESGGSQGQACVVRRGRDTDGY